MAQNVSVNIRINEHLSDLFFDTQIGKILNNVSAIHALVYFTFCVRNDKQNSQYTTLNVKFNLKSDSVSTDSIKSLAV